VGARIHCENVRAPALDADEEIARLPRQHLGIETDGRRRRKRLVEGFPRGIATWGVMLKERLKTLYSLVSAANYLL
jgi:hypothetical protein